jgi:hypothetical protein
MRITAGDDDFFFIGFVTFRDIFDKKYVTGFCLKLNRGDGKFLFEGDQRYNYTRQESQ